jgi:hypothetical protein
MKQDTWNNMTLRNVELPDEDKRFTLSYKDTIFTGCKRTASLITGSSPCGEIHLHTTVQMILAHDIENETITRWRYEK